MEWLQVGLNGTAVQVINGSNTGVTFNGLSIQNPTGVSTNKNITVTGILNLLSTNPNSTTGALDMGSYTLLMGASSTTTGTGDVTGIVKRTTIANLTNYTFNNQNASIYFEDIDTENLPTEISVRLTLGVAPVWRTDAVKRIYEIIQTGSVYTYPNATQATIRSAYLDCELSTT